MEWHSLWCGPRAIQQHRELVDAGYRASIHTIEAARDCQYYDPVQED